MKAIPNTDHLVTLHCEPIDAMGKACSECGARPDRLLVYSTLRGQKSRTHRGQFCGKLCHDIFHGLQPKRRSP